MNTLRVIAILSLVAIIGACEVADEPSTNPKPGDELQPTIGEPYQSACLQALTKEDDAAGSVKVLVDGNSITIVDSHAEFNCCLKVWMVVDIEGNNIVVREQEDPDKSMACFCICPYQLSIQVGNLVPGEYQVAVYREGADGDQLLLDETIEVPE